MKLLKICNEKYNQTIVVVTHDEKVAQMCDRIIYIEDGRLRCIFREICASVPKERSAIPLETEQRSVG